MGARKDNRPPTALWERSVAGDGLERHQLWIGGERTPFFIDRALTIGHRTQGERFGLWGAGMGPATTAGYRIARALDSGPRIAPLKHRAEQMAMGE